MADSARLRAAAASVVNNVAVGRQSLDSALAQAESGLAGQLVDFAGRSLLRAICYGTLRFHPRLSFYLDNLVARPIRRRDATLGSLLLTGLYQLDSMRVAPHAVVAETVNAARLLGFNRASGMANAVLRRFQREADALRQRADDGQANAQACYAHPLWLIEALKADWPQHWQQILRANNEHPPFWLRVNLARTTLADAQSALAAAGHAATTAGAGLSAALQLEKAADTMALPGFADGLLSVQDAAAQLAALLLDAGPGHRVLDACAAPGGKTAHILERARGIELVALDSDALRLERVGETLERLQLKAATINGRAQCPTDWWDGKPFDRILLDAPCSATGVIRRHPDIKLLRRPHDIQALAAGQLAMLEALWPLLAPGGRLVYATCSVLRRENAQVVTTFLARRDDAEALSPAAADGWGHPDGNGRQIFPGEADMDGFYYACMEKAR